MYTPCKVHSCLSDRESENTGSHVFDVNIGMIIYFSDFAFITLNTHKNKIYYVCSCIFPSN